MYIYIYTEVHMAVSSDWILAPNIGADQFAISIGRGDCSNSHKKNGGSIAEKTISGTSIFLLEFMLIHQFPQCIPNAL